MSFYRRGLGDALEQMRLAQELWRRADVVQAQAAAARTEAPRGFVPLDRGIVLKAKARAAEVGFQPDPGLIDQRDGRGSPPAEEQQAVTVGRMDRELIHGVKNRLLVYGGAAAVALGAVVLLRRRPAMAGYRRRRR